MPALLGTGDYTIYKHMVYLMQIDHVFISDKWSVHCILTICFSEYVVCISDTLPHSITYEQYVWEQWKGVKEKLNFLFNEECIEEKSC